MKINVKYRWDEGEILEDPLYITYWLVALST